jgi:hypothetical protein
LQLVNCQEPGCLQPEHWDGKFETAKHYQEYHPATLVNTGLVEEHHDYSIVDWASLYAGGSFQETFADIFQETFDLLIARQQKYGPDNILQQGILGIFTRMNDDKMNRVRKVLNGTVVDGRVALDPIVDEQDDDTFEDALMDIANYALIMLSLHRGVWGKPLQEDLND